jgi:hypothetical protein
VAIFTVHITYNFAGQKHMPQGLCFRPATQSEIVFNIRCARDGDELVAA